MRSGSSDHRDVPETGQGHEPGRRIGPPGPAGLVGNR